MQETAEGPGWDHTVKKERNQNEQDMVKSSRGKGIKTVAQTTIATIGTTAMLTEVNWLVVASTAALAGVLSILTSVAGLPEVQSAESGVKE